MGCVLSHNDLNVWRRGDGLYKVRKWPSHTTRWVSPSIIYIFFLLESRHIHSIPQKGILYIPPQTLIHAGKDVKEVWGIWWSVFICSISLFFSERNKSHVGDVAWGLRVHPSLSSSPPPSVPPSPRSPVCSLHLIRIPLKRNNVLLMFNNAGEPDVNEPETKPERSNLNKKWETSLSLQSVLCRGTNADRAQRVEDKTMNYMLWDLNITS